MTAAPEKEAETVARLLAQKREIFAALQQLELDREEGAIDAGAYGLVRRRYEAQAALILRSLDEHSGAVETTRTPAGPSRLPLRWTIEGAIGLAIAAIGVCLVTSVSARPAPPSALQVAQQRVQQDPRSPGALIALGNLYLHRGDAIRADKAYQAAMRAAPGAPEPVTLHAMMLGTEAREGTALSLLSGVERRHPHYARAWLLDGLLSSHLTSGYRRAVRSWERFLRLKPHAPISPTVRTWLAGARRALQATNPSGKAVPARR